jgi:hypothetical protein
MTDYLELALSCPQVQRQMVGVGYCSRPLRRGRRLYARRYEIWREQDVRTVWVELHAARARVPEGWDRLPEVTNETDEWFRESGEDHYAEHLPRLRQWAGELTG